LTITLADAAGLSNKSNPDFFALDDSVDQLPSSLVLLILSPDFLFNFAYLNLVWQLHSFSFDGFASLSTILCEGKGQFNIIILSFVLFSCQLIVSALYFFEVLTAKGLVLSLTWINFILPTIVIISVMYLHCKFSGVPKRDEYKSRLKKMQWAVSAWSVTRLIRAITSLWDINLLFGMMM
jgi:hypothetical protein